LEGRDAVPILARLERLGVDRFTLLLVATVATASALPAHGSVAVYLQYATDIAIGAMFFLYGARLPREVIRGGLVNWRLHLLVLASTFALFPLLGLGMRVLVPGLVSPDLYVGILFLCALPSTVQSSIAFTSIARGNVAAAICSASASNLIGIGLTPVLVALLLGAHGGFSAHALVAIAVQLLLPFLLGQLARPWLGTWAAANKHLLSFTDRGSILLVVYGAFGHAVSAGLWHALPISGFAIMIVIEAMVLAFMLFATYFAAKTMGFNREDTIAIVFCGSKKSLAAGVPMAGVLFPGPDLGMILLPTLLFHQMQLMVCAVLARRWAQEGKAEAKAYPGAVAPPLGAVPHAG
jgi:sodium/bile acid cotransporter 7